jgi:cellulose synthase/poly-beta-1,6-N-acetylglucosamine synthase-like glycosyltransferase
MKSIILATSGLISFLFFALLTLNNKTSRPAVKPKINALSTQFRGAKNKHRIAIVIPFYGESREAIPPYLNLFCTTASGSALRPWLISSSFTMAFSRLTRSLFPPMSSW